MGKATVNTVFPSITVNGSIEATGEINAGESVHLFKYFGDSTISLNYTTNWAHLTNASTDMYIDAELNGFTVSNDTITITEAGDYEFTGKHTRDGDNVETVSIRFYNVTQASGIPVSGAQTMRGGNNFGSTETEAYASITAGDKIVVQYKGDAAGTAVFKNGIIKIFRVHK